MVMNSIIHSKDIAAGPRDVAKGGQEGERFFFVMVQPARQWMGRRLATNRLT